jgi:hypothetical protein
MSQELRARHQAQITHGYDECVGDPMPNLRSIRRDSPQSFELNLLPAYFISVSNVAAT